MKTNLSTKATEAAERVLQEIEWDINDGNIWKIATIIEEAIVDIELNANLRQLAKELNQITLAVGSSELRSRLLGRHDIGNALSEAKLAAELAYRRVLAAWTIADAAANDPLEQSDSHRCAEAEGDA